MSVSVHTGENPVLIPGEEYSWESGTTFPTTYGNMKGYFTMTSLNKGELKISGTARYAAGAGTVGLYGIPVVVYCHKINRSSWGLQQFEVLKHSSKIAVQLLLG